MDRPVAAISWSGGKDSCLALMRAWPDFDVRVMVTMFDEAGARSRSHGLRPDVIHAQAQRLGLTTISERCAWATYEAAFARALADAARLGCGHVIFGDIFEDDHRRWTERLAAGAGLVAHQPLWGEPTGNLVREFLTRGGRASIVTVREACLDDTWLGRDLTVEAIDALTALGADPLRWPNLILARARFCPMRSWSSVAMRRRSLSSERDNSEANSCSLR